MCSIFFSRPPSLTLALDSLEQRHLLKNTVSALACKKKMHLDDFFFVSPTVLSYYSLAVMSRRNAW
jgi:hypothetical protein